MSNLTELKEEEKLTKEDYDIVIPLLTEFTKTFTTKALKKDMTSNLKYFKIQKNINFKGMGGMNFLMWASREGDLDIVKLLLDKGANIDDKDTLSGSTSLMFACDNGKFDIVKLLLERGANVNLINNNENTALHNACEYNPYPYPYTHWITLMNNKLLIIKELLNYGADPNITNRLKQKPIDVFKGTEKDKTEAENLIKQHIIIHGVNSMDSSIGQYNPFGENLGNLDDLTKYIGIGKRRKSSAKRRKSSAKRRKNSAKRRAKSTFTF